MASQPIYQFYAELQDYEPKIWRRFQLMNNAPMSRLAYVVMALFEMRGEHLFSFTVPVAENLRICTAQYRDEPTNQHALRLMTDDPNLANCRIALPDEDTDCMERSQDLNVFETKLKYVVSEVGETMVFHYDFGDDWHVLLRLETVFTDKALNAKALPRVIAGEGYGIVEDCGGVGDCKRLQQRLRPSPANCIKTFWNGMTFVNSNSAPIIYSNQISCFGSACATLPPPMRICDRFYRRTVSFCILQKKTAAMGSLLCWKRFIPWWEPCRWRLLRRRTSSPSCRRSF